MDMIYKLWHGHIIPQEDNRTNSTEMKELLGYMSRHLYFKLSSCVPLARHPFLFELLSDKYFSFLCIHA